VKKIKGNQQVVISPEHDARLENGAEGERRAARAPTVGGLKALRTRKVVVDPLGQIWEAHD